MNLLEAKVLWSYDHELETKTGINNIAAQFTGVPPVHNHTGVLRLTKDGLIIRGDEDLIIPLADVEEAYVGFDESYQRNFVKNLGLLCQPLRIVTNNGISKNTIYLILDYNYFGCAKNLTLFDLLQEMLA
ncbi:hypothetical protein TH53_20800 [Pedobacter lusitanus]|uniref:Uncharacterized protein n=1 Tax=Pedobacter lusitanus TaxID=1503925 RepID=A0A0D0GH41_9SPHI|nr:hypothetical protein [Pedobacter lusitanus]KIO75415.1 hypothetical protein TH53_20800 [Pedobacter lusitanus]